MKKERQTPSPYAAPSLARFAASWGVLATLCLAWVTSANAQTQPPAAADVQEIAWAARVEQVVKQAAKAATAGRRDVRIEVQTGRLDARLRLAPCEHVDVYLPPGYRAWGTSRVGLRCLQGSTRWNVYMPMTVRVLAPALHTREPLAAGTVIGAEHLRLAEADWASADAPAFNQIDALLGRSLSRSVEAGATLRETDLKKRQWFAVGDMVRIVAGGKGFSVAADGVALSPGMDGQTARVRTESGRILTGIATADRQLQVSL